MLWDAMKVGPAGLLRELPRNELMMVGVTAVCDPRDGGFTVVQGEGYRKAATDCGVSDDFGP